MNKSNLPPSNITTAAGFRARWSPMKSIAESVPIADTLPGLNFSGFAAQQ